MSDYLNTCVAVNTIIRHMLRRFQRPLVQFGAWKIDRKDAPFARHVPNIECAIERLDAAASNRETKTEPGPIPAALAERDEHRFRVSHRQSAALVFDIDADESRGPIGNQHDLTAGARELERILQKIAYRGK